MMMCNWCVPDIVRVVGESIAPRKAPTSERLCAKHGQVPSSLDMDASFSNYVFVGDSRSLIG